MRARLVVLISWVMVGISWIGFIYESAMTIAEAIYADAAEQADSIIEVLTRDRP